MEAHDLTVEVRDRDLVRVGVIPLELLVIEFEIKHNNVGTWKCKLPSGHPLGEELRSPGAGLIVSTPEGELSSGPMVKSIDLSTSDDPEGALTLDGVTDDIVLADMLAWPQPSNSNVSTQSVQRDTRTGPAETLMHSFVNANIGPAAPALRRRPLTLGTDEGRGGTTTKSARFEVLGQIVSDLALVADLGFSVTQRGDGLVFETYAVTDRTAEIRLDVRNNTLSAQKVSISAPGVTDVIVQGKGDPVPDGSPEGTEPIRSLTSFENAASIEAEAAWGRRIERVVSKTSADDASELQQAAEEALAEKGFTQVGVQVIPHDGESMRFGVDWGLGDKVTVVANDVEYVSIVTGYKLRYDSDGFFLSADLGDPKNFDPKAALQRSQQDSERRLSALEKNG